VSDSVHQGVTRRDVLKTAGTVAAASALANVVIPHVHAAETSTIKVALVGCGGRGTGAAENALTTAKTLGPINLVAMADVFKEKLASSYAGLKKKFDKQVDVPTERQFVDFEGYKKAIDCLDKGDVVIFATPPAFRWVHFTYAIQKGVNVFMEKPVTVDGPATRKMLKLGEESVAKGLKVGVGLMCRHCVARGELHDLIKQGDIGEILLLRAYRQAGVTGHSDVPPRPKDFTEVMYQIKNFHGFFWASGGAFSDFLIHNIDECCWMKDAWPIRAEGTGARTYRGNYIDQNFDTYSVEYTFADGTKLQLEGRTIPGCRTQFASYAHGTNGSAIISTASHTPAKPRIFKGHNFVKADQRWAWAGGNKPEPDPYQLEWDDLITAIRNDKPYNEVKRGAEASLVTSMGRMAAHTGQLITFEQMLNHDHEFAPTVDRLTPDTSAPVVVLADGKYPMPEPGKKKTREF
jgi:predicted dehydrogenase